MLWQKWDGFECRQFSSGIVIVQTSNLNTEEYVNGSIRRTY